MPQGSKVGPWTIQDLYTWHNMFTAHFIVILCGLYYKHGTQHWHGSTSLHLQSYIHLLKNFFAIWSIKVNSNKSIAAFFSRKCIPPSPLNLNGSFDYIYREVKYLHDSTLTWRSTSNIVFVNFTKNYCYIKRYLTPILLNCVSIYAWTANSNIQNFQVVQNKVLRGNTKPPWYRRNLTIHNDLEINPIRKTIKNNAIKCCFEWIHSITNPELFNLSENDEHIERVGYRRLSVVACLRGYFVYSLLYKQFFSFWFTF